MITLSSGTEAELRYEKGRQRENVTLGKVAKYCWASLTIFVYQGSSWWPRGATSRLLSGVLMLIAIVFGSVYSGSITAFLAIPFRSQPVNSLDDLVATDIKPAFREGASTYNFFVEQTEGVLGKVKARMTSFTAAQVASWEFFRDIARGRYALIDTSSSALGISAGFEKVGRSCLFHPAREPVRLDLDAFAFPKNSPVIYQFDETMRWLRGYGIIQYMKNQYYKKACDAVAYSDQPKPLSVTQVYLINQKTA
ncbi:uncharacterized protein LOC135200978 isoform X2 [Macrobrachium nipponense]|uniref:uncharacterized protein LOC135200978 isoform X2 n=1 Tax=Macrobrachium nipponense TaxID=159736 RepID=UPI0030C7B08A